MDCQSLGNQCAAAKLEQLSLCERPCDPLDSGCLNRCVRGFRNNWNCCQNHVAACNANQAQPGCTVGPFPPNALLNYGQNYYQAANPSSGTHPDARQCRRLAGRERDDCIQVGCPVGDRGCWDECLSEHRLNIDCCRSSGAFCNAQPTNTSWQNYYQAANPSSGTWATSSSTCFQLAEAKAAACKSRCSDDEQCMSTCHLELERDRFCCRNGNALC